MKKQHVIASLVAVFVMAIVVMATNSYSGGVSGSAAQYALLKSNANQSVAGSSISDDGTTVTINANKFTVTEASGNTAIAGTVALASTLAVTGNATVQGALNFAADAGSNDTYVITLAPAPAAYTTGMLISFTVATANTGACSVAVNGLAAKALKKGVSTDPGDNFLKAGSVVVAVYDGTNFQMIQPAAQ